MVKKRILVVDDEEDLTKILKLNLEEKGHYQVQTENSGNNIVSVVKKFKPDLILLDVAMPDIDGTKVFNVIRSDKEIRDIPVVFLTAMVTEREIEPRGGVIGGHFFLAKPVTTEMLIECIEDNLNSNKNKKG